MRILKQTGAALVAGVVVGIAGFLSTGSALPEVAQIRNFPRAAPVAFNKCSTCHSDQVGTNGIGPSLFNIVGKVAGKVAGYAGYSNAMTNSTVVWGDATLDGFISNPQAVVPGTSMPTIATTPQERADIIAYLKTLVPASTNGPFGTGGLVFKNAKDTLCYFRNHFFGRDLVASYSLFDESVSPAQLLQGPFKLDGTGIYSADGANYGIIPPQPKSGLTVRVVCDGVRYRIPLNAVSGLDPDADLVLKNTVPVIEEAVAELPGGRAVKAVPRGTKVLLRAHVSDAEKDARIFKWRVTAGSLDNTTGNPVRWTLPSSSGLHFAYLMVTDGKGGYRDARVAVSTDGGTVFAPALSPKPPPQPSDTVPASDQFLTFFSTQNLNTYRGLGADAWHSSCQYYVDIGAAQSCGPTGSAKGTISFSDWQKKWGFENPHSKAIYANVADLNLQRNMHGRKTAKGTAFFVCNHPNDNDRDLQNAVGGKKLVACVAMEHSVTAGKNGGKPFIKFLTFGPTGRLIQSVNLDERDEKFMPGACVTCHGASPGSAFIQNGGRYPETPANPNLGSLFLPFDLENFVFSRKVGLRRADQEQALFRLNQLVREADQKIAPDSAVTKLIDGWYPTDAPPFRGNFVPPGWAGEAQLYNKVVKPACRTCHVALSPAFDKHQDFLDFRNQIASFVCGNRRPNDIGFSDETLYRMPNALVTFNRFWNDPDQHATMLAFLQAEVPGTICELPQE